MQPSVVFWAQELNLSVNQPSPFLFYSIFKFYLFYLFRLGYAACGVLFPRPGVETATLAVEVQSLNHWTARKVPVIFIFNRCIKSHSMAVSIVYGTIAFHVGYLDYLQSFTNRQILQ